MSEAEIPEEEAISVDLLTDPRTALEQALEDPEVVSAAEALSATPHDQPKALGDLVRLAAALAQAAGYEEWADRLEREVVGYGEGASDVPEVRRAMGFASPFPVRALDLGLLDPEEIFSAGNEKFSQVYLTIGQPLVELEQALGQIRAGGVLALKVPASEIANDGAEAAPDAEVYIYILPREIERIVEDARATAFSALAGTVAAAALATPPKAEEG